MEGASPQNPHFVLRCLTRKWGRICMIWENRCNSPPASANMEAMSNCLEEALGSGVCWSITRRAHGAHSRLTRSTFNAVCIYLCRTTLILIQISEPHPPPPLVIRVCFLAILNRAVSRPRVNLLMARIIAVASKPHFSADYIVRIMT